MNSITKQVYSIIQKEKLFTKKTPLLLSFSCGPDSVFLLKILLLLDYKNITLIYFNHHLRTKDELAKELTLCKHIAAEHNLKLKVKSLPVKHFKTKYKTSIEHAARLLRRSYLNHYAMLLNIRTVLTAHHYDDQIESILLRYQKGTHKLDHPIKTSSKLSDKVMIKRPLLAIQKSAILQYLDQYKIKYSLDTSNNENQYQRNIIRNKWLPLLKTINPHMITLLDKSLSILPELISKSNNDIFSHVTSNEHILNLTSLDKDATETIRAFIHQYYDHLATNRKRINGLTAYITSEHISNIHNLIKNSQTGKYIELPKNHVCYKGQSKLYLMTAQQLHKTITFESTIHKQVKTHLINGNKTQLNYEQLDQIPNDIISTDTYAYLEVSSKDKVNISIRNIKKTDKFIPYGSSYSKNILTYLEDQKCDWYNRKKVKVVLINKMIAWIVGFTISEKFKISSQTTQSSIIKVTVYTKENSSKIKLNQ